MVKSREISHFLTDYEPRVIKVTSRSIWTSDVSASSLFEELLGAIVLLEIGNSTSRGWFYEGSAHHNAGTNRDQRRQGRLPAARYWLVAREGLVHQL